MFPEEMEPCGHVRLDGSDALRRRHGVRGDPGVVDDVPFLFLLLQGLAVFLLPWSTPNLYYYLKVSWYRNSDL